VDFVALQLGTVGVSSPSRSYNVLAEGKPVIAVVDRTAYLAQLAENEQIAWSVQPGDLKSLVRTVEVAASSDAPLSEMGEWTRKLADSPYSFRAATKQYEDLILHVSIASS
jgi:glycosyltransferase involved in cell wall biosynthesis